MGMSKISGVLCTIVRRFVETDYPSVNFRSVCEESGCECGSSAFSVAHRVYQQAFFKLVSKLSAATRRDEEQFLEDLGRSVAGILRSSYPTTFRNIHAVAEFATTAVSIDYSLLFPVVPEELAPILWNSRTQGREIVFTGLPARETASYLRGFFDGAATVTGQPVAVRSAPTQPSGYRLTVVPGQAAVPSDGPRKAV